MVSKTPVIPVEIDEIRSSSADEKYLWTTQSEYLCFTAILWMLQPRCEHVRRALDLDFPSMVHSVSWGQTFLGVLWTAAGFDWAAPAWQRIRS